MNEISKVILVYAGSGTAYVFDKEQDVGFQCEPGGSYSISAFTAAELLGSSSDWSISKGVSDGE